MRRLRPSKRKLNMQGLQSADLFSQPVGPLFHAIATRGGNGENGCLGVQVGNMAIEQILVKREHGQGIDLVQYDGGSSLENAWILQRLVVTFGHRKDHRLHVFAQIKIGWAHQIAHVLDDDKVELVHQPHGGSCRFPGGMPHPC